MRMHGEKTTSFCKGCKCKPLQIYGKEFGLVGTDKGYYFHELPEKLLMTSHLDGHITTDLKPDMPSGIKTGNRMPHDQPEIECHMIKKCMWHCACKNMQKRRHFQAKTTNLNT